MSPIEIELELAKIRSEVELQKRLWDKLFNFLKDKYEEHSKELCNSCVPAFHDGYLQCLEDVQNQMLMSQHNKE